MANDSRIVAKMPEPTPADTCGVRYGVGSSPDPSTYLGGWLPAPDSSWASQRMADIGDDVRPL